MFDVFLELYSLGGQDGITWQEMDSYCNMRRVVLSQVEIGYIIKIRSWVEDETASMRDDSMLDRKDD